MANQFPLLNDIVRTFYHASGNIQYDDLGGFIDPLTGEYNTQKDRQDQSDNLATAAAATLALRGIANGTVNTALSYDISSWAEYGLPSDGYFSEDGFSAFREGLHEGQMLINMSGTKGGGFIEAQSS